MPFQDVAILLPCHSLEDFPVHLDRKQAADLLAAWSLSWHPQLLASTGRLPSWHPAAAPPEQMPETAILVPSASADELPAGWVDRIEADSHGAVLVREFAGRPWDLEVAIPGCRSAVDAMKGVGPDIVRDFFALGFCYLMVELQSRQMRYSSNLDTLQLQDRAVAAAMRAVEDDLDAARDELTRAFDALGSARDYYYPVDSYLVDVTLVAASLFGKPLRDRLAEPTPTNVLVSGEMLEQMAVAEPESLAALRAAIDRETASIVGGGYREIDMRLAPPEVWIRDFERARPIYMRHLGVTPRVYGRRGLEIIPRLPQVLQSAGFSSILGSAFDGRALPKSQQSKTQWAGAGSARIDALWCVPTDTAAAESLLRFAHDAGEAMDHDFVATLLFAGWPGAACPWYDDLRRAADFGLALGQFVTLDRYFETTAHSDAVMRPPVAAGMEVRSTLAVPTNPISSAVANRAHLAAQEREKRFAVFSELLVGDGRDDPAANESLVINLHSIPQTVHLPSTSAPFAATSDPPGLSGDAPAGRVAGPTVGVGWGPPPDHFVNDVPGLGFARVENGSASKPPAPLAEELRLQNEFLQVEFDEVTGAIRGIGEYARRGPSVAQQIAFRTPGADSSHDRRGRGGYSVMAADSIRIACANAACGEMGVAGRLLNFQGETIAEYRQTTRLARASRLVLLDIEITPRQFPESSRSESYYALRFAWPVGGEAWVGDSGVGTRQSSGSDWIRAGDYVDVRQPAGSWTLFPMGIPIHRRVGDTELDTLLIVDGETCHRYRCAIGIGQPAATLSTTAASLFDVAEPVRLVVPRSRSATSAWLFHVDAANVYWSQIDRLQNDRQGVAVGLMETTGHATETRFRTFRDVTAARQMTLAGEPVGDLTTDGGMVQVRLEPYECIQLEIDWA